MGEEAASVFPIHLEVRTWASQLAAESRLQDWTDKFYVWPEELKRIWDHLEDMRGGIIGLVGLQGVGKSSALQAILRDHIAQVDEQWKSKGEKTPWYAYSVVLFKWRRKSELFQSLLSGSHEASEDFLREYLPELWERSSSTQPRLLTSSTPLHRKLSVLEEETKSMSSRLAAAKDPAFYSSGAALVEVERLERRLDRPTMERLRESAWLRMLRHNDTILIDTPDYSKTDRRLMARDLEEIYRLWNTLASSPNIPPNIILAIQKEMFRGHFFFDKMRVIELKPLQPERMVEAYMRRFETTHPFNEEALLAIARMSRGIFRRFLRYVLLTIEMWETRPKPRDPIDIETVKQAITTERLAEDMELELLELFPRHSDLRLEAVRLLIFLEESGPTKQSELCEELGIEPYAISRLLRKLELHRYVTRERAATDKIVSINKDWIG